MTFCEERRNSTGRLKHSAMLLFKAMNKRMHTQYCLYRDRSAHPVCSWRRRRLQSVNAASASHLLSPPPKLLSLSLARALKIFTHFCLVKGCCCKTKEERKEKKQEFRLTKDYGHVCYIEQHRLTLAATLGVVYIRYSQGPSLQQHLSSSILTLLIQTYKSFFLSNWLYQELRLVVGRSVAYTQKM